MRKVYILMTIVLFTINGSIALAHSTKTKQAELDKACETDRQIALKPRKNEIYHECLTKFKKSKSVCQDEADVYNGNRINGAPMFYELPACEKAFQFRKKTITGNHS
ncbi:hypothetical protein [Candidatus Colwellia aromaticivorans]|uniref:hypothetical protein n=1 Tax=Candidatus Colwellia aromaticivorans TaxID=2267621 RepID=UPI000DF1D46F|nr:hypothetical protein [Candidatus Colwellia aromaticivorans]